jgi:hypothetical protein
MAMPDQCGRLDGQAVPGDQHAVHDVQVVSAGRRRSRAERVVEAAQVA